MEHYSSDVSTVFAFIDVRHKFYDVVIEHFNTIKNAKYVLLNHVKTTFIFTYNDNLKKIGEIILSTIASVKEILEKRRRKDEASDIIKNTYLKSEMEKLIKQQKDKELNPADYNYFKNILLKDYPLIELLNDEEKLEEFDSIYILKAEEIVNDKLQEFISFFNNIDKNLKLNPVKIKEWKIKLEKIKRDNLTVFSDYDDEDIKLSSEYFTYCEDRRMPLNFSSTDENLINSLKYVVEERKFKTGKLLFLLKK